MNYEYPARESWVVHYPGTFFVDFIYLEKCQIPDLQRQME